MSSDPPSGTPDTPSDSRSADPTAARRSVAVLGTGIMGAGMARNLAAAGHDVRAWNRTIARAEPLADAGVRVLADPAEAVRDADVVLTMLLDGPAVRKVMGVAGPALQRGATWMQSSTVGPDAQRELAALAAGYGLLFLDAPVLGTRQPAETGQLTVLAAGPAAAREAAGPVLDAVSSTVVWVGDDGADGPASALKLVVNSWVLAVTNATGEVMALAKGLGVDPDGFFAAIGGGPMDLPYLRMKAAAIRAGDFAPNFTVDGALKDLRLVVAAGERGGVRLDLAAAGAERFRRASEQGHGGEDMAAGYFASFEPPPDA